jgi:quercetin dioxygenase-like cupin family protein
MCARHLDQPPRQTEDLMPVVRSADIPVDKGPGKSVQLIATPETGGHELLILRGSFAPMAGNSLHSHDNDETVLYLQGSGRYTIGDDSYEVSEGDVVLIPRGILHEFTAITASDGVAIYPGGTRTFAPNGDELT